MPLHFPYKDTPSSAAQPASIFAKVPYPVSKEPVPQGATASAAQPGKLKQLRVTFDTASVPKEAIANIAEAKKLEQLDIQKPSKANSAEQPASNTSMGPDTEPVKGPSSRVTAQPKEDEQSPLTKMPDTTPGTVADPATISRTTPAAP